MSKEHYIIPIFVPHWGCPHDCVFCNQQEITGQKKRITSRKVKTIIDEYLATIPATAQKIEVAFYGGSFTGIKPEYQIDLLAAAKSYLQRGEITGIRLSTRPDYIDEQILERLKKYGVQTVELGVQSLDNEVLRAAGRGHTREQVIAASEQVKAAGFDLGIQIMPGLPNSSKESDLATGEQVVDLAPDFVRIYPTLVLEGTELVDMYRAGDYQPLELEAAVKLSVELLKLFRAVGISVIRIGLQPSAGINQEQVVSGPFHPAFRQLVEARLMLERVVAAADLPADKLQITVNPRDVSIVRGQKNKNLQVLQTKYEIEEVAITTNSQLARGQIKVD